MRQFALLLALVGPAMADPAEIVAIEASASGGVWRFEVTLRHGDTGWDDYADGWRVETPSGEVLATRVLAHPHVQEQPFTRSLGGVQLPDDLREVHIRASESRGGWGDSTTRFELPQ